MVKTRCMVLALATLVLAACGSGGGSSSSGNNKVLAVMQTTSPAVSTSIAAISATLTFPEGITVKTDPADPHQPAASVVELVNAPASGSLVFARYSAAWSYREPETNKLVSFPGKLKFSVMDVNGFTTEEKIYLRLDVTPGFFPQASDFNLTNYSFSDVNGAILVGVTPTLTTTIQ